MVVDCFSKTYSLWPQNDPNEESMSKLTNSFLIYSNQAPLALSSFWGFIINWTSTRTRQFKLFFDFESEFYKNKFSFHLQDAFNLQVMAKYSFLVVSFYIGLSNFSLLRISI